MKSTLGASEPDLDAAWTVLETEAPDSGIVAVPANVEILAGSVLIGVDAASNRHLLIPLRPGEVAEENRDGQAVQLWRLNHDGTHYLTAVCLKRELQTVFTQFVRELLTQVAGQPSPAKATVETLANWRRLFRDAPPEEVLSEARQIGLIAELTTLGRLLRRGAPSGIGVWTGPAGAQHDFRSRHHALEVKATLLREGRIVHISSLDQLDAPAGLSLHLSHFRFDRDPNGMNLPEAVADVMKRGADVNRLEEKLATVGYHSPDMELYAGSRFRLIENRVYDVEGASFPRIIGSSFVVGHAPAGTLRLAYAIDLTNEPPTPLPETETEKVLRQIAQDK